MRKGKEREQDGGRKGEMERDRRQKGRGKEKGRREKVNEMRARIYYKSKCVCVSMVGSSGKGCNDSCYVLVKLKLFQNKMFTNVFSSGFGKQWSLKSQTVLFCPLSRSQHRAQCLEKAGRPEISVSWLHGRQSLAVSQPWNIDLYPTANADRWFTFQHFQVSLQLVLAMQ